MADNVKETIKDAGKAVSDAAKKAAENVKAGASTVAEKAADATKAVGDTVKKGQLIGYVGSTGFSTGAHTHWEIAVGGVLVDGLRWLDGSQGF